MRIVFNGQYKSITPFEWDDIPEFAVITGINGTGKSQLLELIYGTVAEIPNFPSRVEIYDVAFTRDEVAYLKAEWELEGTGYMSFSTVQQVRENTYNLFANRGNWSQLSHSQPRLFWAFDALVKRIGKEPHEVKFEEFNLLFPEVIIETEPQLSNKISELFVRYRMNEIDLQAKGKTSDEIKTELGEKPWNVLRKIIETAQLPFEITDPEGNGLWERFHLSLRHKQTGFQVSFADLSSGEKVLMSLVFYLYTSKEKKIFPKIFLLDEPDAHLHPSMSQQFLNVMNKVLVDELNVRVMMTTHSPSTVALAPEEAIFTASLEGDRVKKSNKDAALKLLTSGVPSFSVNYENRRQVFVESKYDVYYYESVYKRVLSQLEPEVSLIFIASGDVRRNKHGTPASSCQQVIEVTNVLRQAGNRFIWGLIDSDGTNKDSEFIKVFGNGNRYSVENYLLDPILVAALLLREKLVEKNYFGLDENETFMDFGYFNNVRLQQIADNVLDQVEKQIHPTNTTRHSVQLINGSSIELPLWYLQHNGHDLEEGLVKAFPALNGVKRGREETLKYAVVERVIDDLPGIVSVDFVTTFKDLQAI